MSSKKNVSLKDILAIIRLRLAKIGLFSLKENIEIKGVPVNIISDIKRNQETVDKVKKQFVELDKNFENLILLTAEALRAVGKHLETDIYLERRILEGSREKDAYRYFLVDRQEVDRSMLMMIFNRGGIEKLKELKQITKQGHYVACEKSRLRNFGSVIDEEYSSEVIHQVEYYFDILFSEETIVHVLGSTQKIINILRLPYELPKNVYTRKSYPTTSSSSLTELIFPENITNQPASH